MVYTRAVAGRLDQRVGKLCRQYFRLFKWQRAQLLDEPGLQPDLRRLDGQRRCQLCPERADLPADLHELVLHLLRRTCGTASGGSSGRRARRGRIARLSTSRIRGTAAKATRPAWEPAGLRSAPAYAKTNGYGLLSGNGITLPPSLPPGVIPPEWLLLYGGSGYSFSLGTTPIRRLTLAPVSPGPTATPSTGLIFSANHNEQIFVNGNYQFRKLTFTGGYGRLVQGFSASGVPASNVNSIYFGVSRYFNFF